MSGVIAAQTLTIGVDVGGTFTKAVAVERSGSNDPVASAIVPTTHRADSGVAEGVVAAIVSVATQLGDRQTELELVSISTTQAVNALLEGDLAKVGVLALCRAHHSRRARKRTRLRSLEVAPGRKLETEHVLVELDGSDPGTEIARGLDRLAANGAEAVAISSAFGVDDPTVELRALELASERGLPACAGHQLSGLYGLELRTQTAAINASILPVMQRTARMVRAALDDAGIEAPRVVMRGDGGSTPLGRLEREPIRTLFSGPAASIAGALRVGDVRNALVIEHGGTSTNISAIVDGEPVRDYVRVMNFATCVRALDVCVVGVAGGSLIRQRRRGRYEFGPRSAHQAGLPYACFSAPLERGEVELLSPLPGDPESYLVVRDSSGRRVAVTPTCCANALGLADSGSQPSAQIALEAVARYMGRPWRDVAQDALRGAAATILDLARPLLERYPQAGQSVITAGGAAAVLGPVVAEALGAAELRAHNASVLSSIGSARSLLRAEVERTVPTESESARKHTEHEATVAVLGEIEQDGADPDTIELQIEHDRELGTVRAVATGSSTSMTGQGFVWQGVRSDVYANT